MRSTVTPLRDGRTKTGGWRGGGCDMGRFGEVHRKFPPLRTNSSFVLIGSVRVCGRGLGFPERYTIPEFGGFSPTSDSRICIPSPRMNIDGALMNCTHGDAQNSNRAQAHPFICTKASYAGPCSLSVQETGPCKGEGQALIGPLDFWPNAEQAVKGGGHERFEVNGPL